MIKNAPSAGPRARTDAPEPLAESGSGLTALPDLLAPKNGVMLAVEKALLRGDGAHASPPIAEQIAARLAGLIALDVLQPGQRLFENDISAALHVSRSPVREAIRILERDHLVVLHARRGASVTAPQADELQDIFEVRTALFTILLEQVMQERPHDLRQTLERFLPELERAASESTEAYAVQSFLCNLAIADLCSNRLVVDQLKMISLRTMRYVRLGLAAGKDAVTGSLAGWRVFLRAVARRDVQKVVDAATRRIRLIRDLSVAEIGKATPVEPPEH
ncbi:MAG: GntR family transcriptional regulator [Rhodoferax sp.]|nr:GntR family transcriptional regulator [Rhodoferax sp.]MCB2042995.1 GntR family transcriptional regulator [Rhodoferax sp.]